MTDSDHLSVAIVIPTYRRPECIERCLHALVHQTRKPERVVVVVRRDDDATLAALEQVGPLDIVFDTVLTDRPGQAAAIGAGVATCREAVIAHCDDDTVPAPDWLRGLLCHYSDDVGGVGGRDIINGEDNYETFDDVGRLTWYGRHIGNHHAGAGDAREVDVLKNASISLRRELWKTDFPLRGTGAQTHLELAVCLRARRLGWRLIYDPSVTVDHFPAARFDGDGRGRRKPRVIRGVAFNAAYAFASYLSWPRLAATIPYILFVGNRHEPGLGLAAAMMVRSPRRAPDCALSALASTVGRLEGIGRGLRDRAAD